LLTKLGLENFKPFGDRTSVELSPLTLLAGPNSAGKSSLLQALLLLGQASSPRAAGQPIELNGHLVDLGTTRELSHRGERKPIVVGCEVNAHAVDRGGAPQPDGVPPRRLAAASIEVEFSAPPHAAAMGWDVRLDRLSISARADDSSERTLEAVRRRGRRPAHELPIEFGQQFVLPNSLYRFEWKGDWLEEAAELRARFEEPSIRPVAGIELRGVLPNQLFVPFDPVARQVAFILRQLLRLPVGLGIRRSVDLLDDRNLRDPFLDFWSLGPVGKIVQTPVSSVEDAISASSTFRPSQRNQLRPLITDYARALARRADAPVAYEREPLPGNLAEAALLLASTLGQLRHLGPLRESPRPFQSLPSSGDPLSVGPSGEFTAAVLHRNATREVDYTVEGREVTEPLQNAVNFWLRRMGVHSGAKAFQFGKMGHLLAVDDAALPRWLDLTQVGVGVSQLLPVLVQVLIAPRRSLVVLEQPELHLHPGVQSGLADLLLAVSRSGRQVICETHSEYLITRLRILVANSLATYGEDFRVHFVQRFEAASHVQEVVFGPGSRISNWPPGFFDQSAHDSAALLKAEVERT
jgi:predicted ATPase